MLVPLIVSIIISLGAIFGAFFLLKRQMGASVGAERDSLLQAIPNTIKEVENLLKTLPNFASKGQIENLIKQNESALAAIEKEKTELKNIETRLEEAQKAVESKEANQQQLKTSNESEEQKIAELLEKFEEYSAESTALEQNLAASITNLDRLMQEVELTPDQMGVLQNLSDALTEAGARLRDMIMEYTAVKERIELLKQQHADLEVEYTHLVEQQLGE